jgi:hypothetical protein
MSDIWVEINRVRLELDRLTDLAARNILSREAGRLNREYEARAVELRRELSELQAKIPPEGMRSGQRLVMARILGEVILREDPEPDYADVHAPVDIWDWSEP